MSPSTKTGLFRIGILLSIIWVLAVGAITLQEGQDQSKLCSATDMTLPRPCHQLFWSWERPQDKTQQQQAAKNGDDKDQGIHIHIGKINVDVERGQPLEHHLNVAHLLLGLFGPLLALWGIGYGVVWCVEGFSKGK